MDEQDVIRTALINGDEQTIREVLRKYESDPRSMHKLIVGAIESTDYINPSLIDYLLELFSQYGSGIALLFYQNEQYEAYYNALLKLPYDLDILSNAMRHYVDIFNVDQLKYRQPLLLTIDAYENKITFQDIFLLSSRFVLLENDIDRAWCNIVSYIIFRIYDDETVKQLPVDRLERLVQVLYLGGAPAEVFLSVSKFIGINTYELRSIIPTDIDLFYIDV